MHLVAAAAKREIALEATVLPADYETPDGQWNAYLSDRLLSLFMYVTMLRCVSDNISSRSVNYARWERSRTEDTSESFRIGGNENGR